MYPTHQLLHPLLMYVIIFSDRYSVTKYMHIFFLNCQALSIFSPLRSCIWFSPCKFILLAFKTKHRMNLSLAIKLILNICQFCIYKFAYWVNIATLKSVPTVLLRSPSGIFNTTRICSLLRKHMLSRALGCSPP